MDQHQPAARLLHRYTGVKTGSGLEAGYCLAFSAIRSGKTVYGVILAPTNATTRKVGRGEAAQLRLRQARLTGVAAPLAEPVVFRTTLPVRCEIRLSDRRQAPRLGPIDV
ncbi:MULTISPECIES: hypothetical protein [Streptomyces]|uniref:hypothetical protein n=1 Tax=Streptomyces TaxID=1883 RepID=UPI001EFA9501|nr:hypothetical protein [Streptomyces sp. CL12-4]MCG8968842.1 hypothetical protein [Streptomyces sp. CL12-4]